MIGDAVSRNVAVRSTGHRPRTLACSARRACGGRARPGGVPLRPAGHDCTGRRARWRLPVDGMTDERLAAFRRLCAPAEPHLVITARRAQALRLTGTEGPIGLAIASATCGGTSLALAADADVERGSRVVPAGPAAGAAIELAKLAQRLPALLVAERRQGGASHASRR